MRRKVASKDFSVSDLPSNRKEVFFDSIKNRYKYLMFSGFILFFTVLPVFIVLFLKSFYLSTLLKSFSDGSISEAEYYLVSMRWALIFDIGIVLLSFIVSIGLSGLTRVIRQVGWIEPVFFFKDFGDGIKLNYKHISFHMFILSLVFLVSDISLYINMGFKLLNYIPMAILIFIIVPIVLYSIAQTNIYNMKLSEEIKNSMQFVFKSVPVCILFSLGLSIIVFIGLIPNYMISLLIYVLLLIFVFPIYYLLWFLYSSFMFDKTINAEAYPEIIDKGITRK